MALTLALVSVASASPPATALAVRPPRLGNWEGVGSRGTAISFHLVRSGHRVVIGGGLTVTLPTSPVLCPAGPMEAAALHFKRVSYAGPGSPPIAIFHFRPRDVDLDVYDRGIPVTFSGTLRDRRTMVLRTRGVAKQPRGCGWPKRLRFVVHPKHRTPATPGTWSGTFTGAAGVIGTVSTHVSDDGHIVDDFSADLTCDGGPSTGASAPMAEEFIHPDGSFSGPLGPPSKVNGQPFGWMGRFSGDTLTGTFSTWNLCTGGGPLLASFAAHPA